MSAGTIGPETLRAYLNETLTPTEMARVEKALRDSAELRQMLEDVRQDRPDARLHTLGAIWRRSRLSCPRRDTLGSYLLDALDQEYADYITFHIQVIECPFCSANLADLRVRAEGLASENASRHTRIFRHTRAELLGGEG